MNENFTVIINEVLKYEGGYVNNPADPGGETNYGISKKSYPNVDIKALTKTDAIAIYFRDYWVHSGCESLSFPIAACVFDTAVNAGIGRAKALLKDSGEDWRKYIQLRREFYLGLIGKNPKLETFRKGWLARLQRLTAFVEEHLTPS